MKETLTAWEGGSDRQLEREKNGKNVYRPNRSGVDLIDICVLLVGDIVDQSAPSRRD